MPRDTLGRCGTGRKDLRLCLFSSRKSTKSEEKPLLIFRTYRFFSEIVPTTDILLVTEKIQKELGKAIAVLMHPTMGLMLTGFTSSMEHSPNSTSKTQRLRKLMSSLSRKDCALSE